MFPERSVRVTEEGEKRNYVIASGVMLTKKLVTYVQM